MKIGRNGVRNGHQQSKNGCEMKPRWNRAGSGRKKVNEEHKQQIKGKSCYLKGRFVILIEEKLHGFGAVGIVPPTLRRIHQCGIQSTRLLAVRMSGCGTAQIEHALKTFRFAGRVRRVRCRRLVRRLWAATVRAGAGVGAVGGAVGGASRGAAVVRPQRQTFQALHQFVQVALVVQVRLQ